MEKHKCLYTRRSHIVIPPSWALWWNKSHKWSISSVPDVSCHQVQVHPGSLLGTLTFLATEKWSYSADLAALRDISSRWPLNRDVASCPPSRAEWPPHYKVGITRLPNTACVKLKGTIAVYLPCNGRLWCAGLWQRTVTNRQVIANRYIPVGWIL